MRLLLKVLSYLLTPFIYMLVRRRVYKGLDDKKRYKERFGITNLAPKKYADVIWFHAASIGESVSILPVLNEWILQNPEDQLLVTTVTKTSAKIMQDRMPKGCVHQYVPFDLNHWVCRFLNHWNPKKLIIVESEFWPSMMIESHKRGIKIYNLNGKLSDSSFKFWTRFNFLSKNIFPKFTHVFAQSKIDTSRYIAVGAGNVQTLPNLKYAASCLPFDEGSLLTLRASCLGRKIWVVASTHDGEEAIVCDWHNRLKLKHSNLLTIIIPRHPVRSNSIAQLVMDNGLSSSKRSQNSAITEETEIYIVDTLGEVGLFYALSPLVLIGGTLVDDIGGHNPVEPGKFACNIVLGPYYANLIQTKQDLKGGISCGDTLDGTFDIIEGLLSHDCHQNLKLQEIIQEYGEIVLSSVMKKVL